MLHRLHALSMLLLLPPQVFTAISDELRAKSNHDLQQYGEWK